MDGHDGEIDEVGASTATTTGDIAQFVKPKFYDPDEGLEADEFVRQHRDRRDRERESEAPDPAKPIVLFPVF